jgi:hypothetical protein
LRIADFGLRIGEKGPFRAFQSAIHNPRSDILPYARVH